MKLQDEIILHKFCKDFWYVPSDVLQRSIEAIIWKRQKFIHPILEIGAGDGRISSYLFPRNIDWGLDNDANVEKSAKESGLYKNFVISDAAKTKFPNSFFNTIIANSTFEHIENDITAVVEVARILKPNGSFMLTVPLPSLEKEITRIENSDLNKTKKLNSRLNHLHYYSLEKWRKIVSKAGLEITKYSFYIDIKLVPVWYRLFQITTAQIYKRELWSYLSDSRFQKFLPKKMISKILFWYLSKYATGYFTEDGCFLFIKAKKIK